MIERLEDRCLLATVFVNNAGDVDDGSCDGTHCTLREAINFANSNSGQDTINFSLSVPNTITLGSGELRVTGSVDINGPGADRLTISGNNSSRVFFFGNQFGSETYDLRGVTLSNGNGVGGRDNGFGGAVFFLDEFVADDTLNLSDSVLRNNTATLGGAIHAAANTLNISNSAIINNSSTGTGDTRGGGGLSFQSMTANLSNVTLSGNTALGTGGAIYNFTFSGAAGAPNSTVDLVNVTIANNTAPTGPGVFNENQVSGRSSTVTYRNSLFVNNDANNTTSNIVNTARNGIATVKSLGSNLSDDTTGNLIVPGDQANVGSPGVGGLNLSGRIPFHPLLAGSPALDAGVSVLTTDQLGAPRPAGTGVDIGAIEFQPATFRVITGGDANLGNCNPTACTLRDAINASNSTPGANTITFALPLPTTITLGLGELRVTDSVSILGPGADRLTISGGNNSRIFFIGNQFGSETYNLSGVTLRDGNGSGARDEGFGGAIFFIDEFVGDDVLNIRDSVLRDNSGSLGGAINVVVNTLNIEDTAIIDNAGTGTGDTRGGGGLAIQSSTANLSNVTISGNTAVATGGGIYNFTFSGAPGAPSSTVNLVNTTVANNTAATGPGIFNENQVNGRSSTVTYHNSLFIANRSNGSTNNVVNTARAGIASVRSLGNNLSDDGTGNLNAQGDLSSVGNPGVGSLELSARIPFHPLQSGSPAIDAINAPFNVAAPFGSAFQTSSIGGLNTPENAIDGLLVGNPTHTDTGDVNPFWEVDLGVQQDLQSIVLTNRIDCCASRLRDITVEIIDRAGQVVFTSPVLNPENVLGGGSVNGGPGTLVLDLTSQPGGFVAGQKVRISRTSDPDLSGTGGVGNAEEPDVLSLQEVQIFAVPATDQNGVVRPTGAGIDIGASELEGQTDIQVQSFTVGNDASDIVINYQIVDVAAPSFEIAFFSSNDGLFNAGDQEIPGSRITINNPSDLTVGAHTVAVNPLAVKNALRNPSTRFVIANADSNNLIDESNETNNDQNYFGLFHESSGIAAIRGRHTNGNAPGVAADVVQISQVGDLVDVQFNGQAFNLSASAVDSYLILTEGGDDNVSATNSVLSPIRAKTGTGADSLTGGGANDQLIGQSDSDLINGNGGNDRILGGRGNDILNGNDGNDVMNGGQDDDNVSGDAGNDRLVGSTGNDTLGGGTGNDSLNGNAGDDQLQGGEDQDRLLGGLGSDILRGGNGNDVVTGMTHLAQQDNAFDQVFGDAGIDRSLGLIDPLDVFDSVERDRRRS